MIRATGAKFRMLASDITEAEADDDDDERPPWRRDDDGRLESWSEDIFRVLYC